MVTRSIDLRKFCAVIEYFRSASATYDVLQTAGIMPPFRHQPWYNVFTTREFRPLLYQQ